MGSGRRDSIVFPEPTRIHKRLTSAFAILDLVSLAKKPIMKPTVKKWHVVVILALIFFITIESFATFLDAVGSPKGTWHLVAASVGFFVPLGMTVTLAVVFYRNYESYA
jgi:hypothetical protein